MELNKYFLAIDGSTSKVGLSLWDLNSYQLIKCWGWSFKGTLTLLEKAKFFEDELKTIISEYNIIEACIEAPKLSMMNMFSGKEQVTSARTLKVLSQINFGYQYILHQRGIHVEELDESLCKKLSYPAYKVKRNGITVKMQYQGQVLEDESLDPKIYNFTYIDKKTEEVKCYKWVEDVIDSLIVGKAYLNIKKQGLKIADIK
jgi:hypothetical protein